MAALEPQFSKTPKAQQRVIWDIAGALVSLLGAVATARDEALEAIVANRAILRFLFVLAANDATPLDLLDELLSCLMTLSEDNLDFGQVAIDDQATRFYDLLLKFKEGSGLRAVYACGILHNIFSSLQWRDHSRGQDGACDAILIPSLTRILSQTSLSQQHSSNGNHNSRPSEVLLLALEVLASMGTDIQDAVEQPGRGGGGGRDEGEWNGFDDTGADADAMDEDEGDGDVEDGQSADGDEDEDEEMGLEEMEADMEMVTGGDHGAPDGSDLDDLPTLKGLIQEAVPLAAKWSQIPLDSDEALAVQAHALSFLNNIAWAMSCFDFADGENPSIFGMWAPAAKKIWLSTVAPILVSDTADLNLAAQVTGLAWAIARSLSGNTPLAGDEHRKFIALYNASKGLDQANESGSSSETAEDPFQRIGVKCIGVLGQLARDPAPVSLNREIGVFLITVLTSLPETPGADAVEALHQIFDTYGDEKSLCDGEVFWKDNFIKHLEDVSPKVKAMAKSIDKRRFGELRSRADDAVLNLRRFITYKRKHAP